MAALERACKEIIETILFSLPNAYKGTVYRVSGPPGMYATRITSGIWDREKNSIVWGLPESSDYNPPGKPWAGYRDEPGRPLEAIAWCVERQKSWTSEDPKSDSRSVRLQVEGVQEDCHHMEPVLVRKADLYIRDQPKIDYPRSFGGSVLWQDSDYVVVAVIKIHFLPATIKIGSPETRIIKRLSRILGTELLSYQLREQSFDAMRQLAQAKLNAANILADSLRNAITKSGLIFSLIKAELGFLREQWENLLLQRAQSRVTKYEAIDSLNGVLLKQMGGSEDELVRDLIGVQKRFLDLCLSPERGEKWVCMQIEGRWNNLLNRRRLPEEQVSMIRNLIENLKSSLYIGKASELLCNCSMIPGVLKEDWVNLIYSNTDRVDFPFLEALIHFLGDPRLCLPYREKSRKSLIRLKALAQIMDELEKNTNVVLREVLDSHDEQAMYSMLNQAQETFVPST